MRTPIHLHTLEHLEVKNTSERLNLFSGRAMSEKAFEKSQHYVADRIAPLLSGVWPGIQQGLEVEYLSKQDQIGQKLSVQHNARQLKKMAYASYSPTYPADNSMPGLNQFKGHYSKVATEQPLEIIDETDLKDIQPLFRVQAGSAVTENGAVVKLFTPLEVKWLDLLAHSKMSTDEDLAGLFMLCLGREIIPVNYDEKSACRRYETDPIQDTRFETVGVLKLLAVKKEQFSYEAIELIKNNRHKTINRFLSQLVIEPENIKLPVDLATLGILAIDQTNPLWFESLACRFLSQPLAFPMALLAHTEQVFKELVAADKGIQFKKTRRAELLTGIRGISPVLAADGVDITPFDIPAVAIDQPDMRLSGRVIPSLAVRDDFRRLFEKVSTSLATDIKNTFQFLPAAGSLPRSLLKHVANINAPLPRFEIDYPGLRVDMMPVPATGVAGILRRELARGVIKFDSATKERIRLLIAVPDAEYHPKLLDVPVSDKVLSAQLYDFGMQAYEAWIEWINQLNKLYNNNLTPENQSILGIPDFSKDRFKAPIAPRNPALSMTNPDQNTSAYDEGCFFDGLIRRQGDNLNISTLAPPYREGVPQNAEYDVWLGDDNELPAPNGVMETSGLIIVRAEIEKDIDQRTNNLKQCYEFVEKISDHILLQRQQLDVQSVSFAAFAGGVAGDGSGLQLTRWLPHVKFTAVTVTDSADDDSSDAGAITVVSSSRAPQSIVPFAIDNSAAVAIQPSNYTYASIANAIPISTAVTWQSNSAYVSQAINNATTSHYETIANLSLGVNKLDQLSINSRAITGDAFKKPNINFGTLTHVSAITSELKNSRNAVQDIQTEIDLLLVDIDQFMASLPQHIINLLGRYVIDSISKKKPVFKTMMMVRRAGKTLPLEGALGTDDSERYSVLFDVGKFLVTEISSVENARTELARLQKILQKQIANKQQKLAITDREISITRKELIQFDAIRRETLDDYSAVQRLLIEHWQEVEEKFNHRNKVLNGMVGLYYVKVRETATSVALPNIQSLAYAEVGDLVPGCRGDEQANLPDELDVFVDAVLDIPVTHWQLLSVKIHQLPGRQRLMTMLDRRKPRIQIKQSLLSRQSSSRIRGLSNLRHQTLFVLNSFSERQFKTVHSLKHLQQEAANVLSLEDLLNNSATGRLRKPAQQLSNNIELACYCLLEKLYELLPSVRLEWGQLAEDDQLVIESPEKWPLLEQAEQTSFNALRSCLELVRWFNRQLSQSADGDSRTALRNLVRACLMLAASDDPSDLLEGQLQVAPRTFQLGSVLRLSLNQEAVPGAILQLLDKNKRTVAKLRLDDQDNDGASATIVKLFDLDSEINTQQFMVIGHKYKDV